jgi:hypothetical protein
MLEERQRAIDNTTHGAEAWKRSRRQFTIDGNTYRMTPKKIKWIERYMETGNGIESALESYNTDSRNMAMVLAFRNKNDPAIQAVMASITENACSSILNLSQGARNEGVRLNASKDILDRLGYKAPQEILVDDRRELTKEDTLAIKGLLSILNPKPKDAILVEEIHE